MVHLYCGDGKGKTTAAMGLSVRMAGAGQRVLIAQFFKDGSSSEMSALKMLPTVALRHCRTVPGRYARLTPEQRQQARRDYTGFLRSVLAEAVEYDLLVLDEVVSACDRGIVPEEELVEFLRREREQREIVLTGRDPSAAMQEQADYITEMKKLRHPFDEGVPARYGVEY